MFCIIIVCSSGSALNDGQWHSVDFTSERGRLSVSVDEGEGGVAHASPSFPVSVRNQLFFGGKSFNKRIISYYNEERTNDVFLLK